MGRSRPSGSRCSKRCNPPLRFSIAARADAGRGEDDPVIFVAFLATRRLRLREIPPALDLHATVFER
jgi:hypothetical protein